MQSSFKLMIAMLFFMSSIAFAHGTKYEIIEPRTITIKAMFDTGTPMSGSKVLVFRPGATKSFKSISTDDNGIFLITPDAPGIWTFQVRDKSGHGMRINLDIDDSLKIKGNSRTGGINYIQKTIMALTVVWGFIGTALYFKRKE